MLQRLADKLVLEPTRHEIPATRMTRRAIPFQNGCLELWEHDTGSADMAEGDLFVLKLAGAGGRAERSTPHPADVWRQWRVRVWALNPPGYGGSDGPASLSSLAAAASTALERVLEWADGRPVVLTGNSLGTLSALYLAARYPIDGLILRNPLPLRQLIVGRYGRWGLRLGARLVARRVPAELDSIANAAQVVAPAVFLSSRRDRVAPPAFQEMVLQAYRGEKQVLRLADADHATPLTEEDSVRYHAQLDWLAQALRASARA